MYIIIIYNNDLSQAMGICNELNIKPTIINLDLIELADSDIFYDIGLKYQSPRIGMHELLYTLEKIEEPAILGDEIRLRFMFSPDKIPSDNSYQKWYFYLDEDQECVFDRY